jgi:ubiquitin-like-conjugating enzyme ATG10
MEQHEDTDVHNCQPSATQHEQISSFPHISKEEFDQACDSLANRFASHSAEQTSWQSVDIIRRDGSQYLRIAKLLTSVKSVGEDVVDDEDNSEFEEQEDDEETLLPTTTTHATIQYDMALSPSYRVPVLYFSIKDPSYRYPPTMQTLYEHIIHPEFKPQVENVGVIGGITIIVSLLT